MRFEKWHALGNAYLVVERDDASPLDADRVSHLCDESRGIGSHGIVEVVHRDHGAAEVVIWNPDGSVAEMSGNGVRIAARWLAELSGLHEVVVTTAGRAVHARMLGGVDAEIDVGEVIVGQPETIVAASRTVDVTTASVGNPHAVVRLDSATRADLLELGPGDRDPRALPPEDERPARRARGAERAARARLGAGRGGDPVVRFVGDGRSCGGGRA